MTHDGIIGIQTLLGEGNHVVAPLAPLVAATRMSEPMPVLAPTLVASFVTLPATIAERLRDFIIEGQLAPGARLNERTLCERLGVSRTPLREAFRLLEADGLVVNVVNGPFSLVPNFGDIFLQSGENGMESVFEIQYSNASPFYDWSNPGRGQGNLAVQVCGIRNLTGTSPYGQGWSTNLPTTNLANAFAAGDKRKEVTVLNIEAYKAANPGFNITYLVAPYKNTGLYNQKYLPRKGETSGQVELNYLNNFRTIRYADVLLMAAEANNRAAAPNDAKAQTYLNKVRRRAFAVTDASKDVTSTGAQLKQAIWDERRLELAMEGDRFFDLVRTGQAASKITGFVAGKNEVFPIPQQEVDISGLVQNPGY